MDQELLEGGVAPNFTLSSNDGRTISLSDYKGKKNVILYFYPKDDTPGCTKEACAFRDDIEAFKKADTEILGVSTDTVKSHQRFVDKFQLNFPLLADDKKEIAKRYGALNITGSAKRMTFLIDQNGIIKKIVAKVKVDGHSQELQETLTRLLSV
ncbi:MAG: peroxiredoxin [Nitrospirae bacterium]|nr:peroxiredoxin [Candidatus Troglogloeales bacterium]MBI3598594.1 peroxiredoxin [Candidatus Troglogloeales bacterium]